MVHLELNKFKGLWLKKSTCALVVVGMVTIMLYFVIPREYQVTLVTEDGRKEISTEGRTVGEVFNELGIEPIAEDYIFPTLDQKLKDGMTIQYLRAKSVTLFVGADEVIQVKTTEPTVQALLHSQKLTLGSMDQVDPTLDNPISEAMSISITRVHQELLSSEQMEQKRKTIRTAAVSSVVAEPEIEQPASGDLQHWYEVTFVNDEPVSHILKEVEIVQSGVRFEPRQILENVELTAYGAGVEHTGKTPEDPGYGITATGRKVKENQTIAVDPKVIPLGWWVYIEGYGLRRAEDTGSAVKGKRIDLYLPSDEAANGFGLKKGYTVYLIGPEKPNS